MDKRIKKPRVPRAHRLTGRNFLRMMRRSLVTEVSVAALT
jgi:hypothetical protein